MKNWIKLFDDADDLPAVNNNVVSIYKSDTSADPLVKMLFEAEQRFDSQLEQSGDPDQIYLRVEIERLKQQIKKNQTTLLTEQSRSLGMREREKAGSQNNIPAEKHSEQLTEISSALLYRAPFRIVGDNEVRDASNKLVCTAPDYQTATMLMGLLSKQYVAIANKE